MNKELIEHLNAIMSADWLKEILKDTGHKSGMTSSVSQIIGEIYIYAFSTQSCNGIKEYINDLLESFKTAKKSSERDEIRAKVAITGLPIGEFLLESALNQRIYIAVGKYQSDRLSIEVRRLREQLEIADKNLEETNQLVQKCICLIEQLLKVIENEDGEIENISINVFFKTLVNLWILFHNFYGISNILICF